MISPDQRYEPRMDLAKGYTKVTKPLRKAPKEVKLVCKREQWTIPTTMDITVELDANQPPTIGEVREQPASSDTLAILSERQAQRAQWERDAVARAAAHETKAEAPAPKKPKRCRK